MDLETALEAPGFALQLLLMAFDGRGGFALAYRRRLLVELAAATSDRMPAFSQDRLKRRSATSKGSFSLTLTDGTRIVLQILIDQRWSTQLVHRKGRGFYSVTGADAKRVAPVCSRRERVLPSPPYACVGYRNLLRRNRRGAVRQRPRDDRRMRSTARSPCTPNTAGSCPNLRREITFARPFRC